MRKLFVVLTALFLCLAQQAFADTTPSLITDDNSKECLSIVNACQGAGYVRNGGINKMFWRDCMGPLLLGKNVDGVNVNSQDVTACRNIKIAKMQQELKELQGAASPGQAQ